MHRRITNITPLKASGFGTLLEDRHIVLQRRGCSTTREFSDPAGKFYLIDTPGRGIEVLFGKEAKKFFRPDQVAYFTDIEAFLAELTGREYRFANETEAYCFTGIGIHIEKTDLFFSPMVFEESTHTIRHIPTNICVVAFDDEDFNKRRTDIDRASEPYQFAIQQALSGIHPCDLRSGFQNGARRLAWLAGEYLKQHWAETQPGAVMPVGVLERNMTTTAQCLRLRD